MGWYNDHIWNWTLTDTSQQGIDWWQLGGCVVWWALQVWVKVWWHHKNQALPDQTSDLKCCTAQDDSSHTLAITLRSLLFSARWSALMSWYIYAACNLYPALAIMPVLFQILVSVEILCTTCERIDWRRVASKQWSCIRIVIRWYLCSHIHARVKKQVKYLISVWTLNRLIGRWTAMMAISLIFSPSRIAERERVENFLVPSCIEKVGEGRLLLWVRPRGGFVWASPSPPAYPWTRWSWCPEIRFVCLITHFSWNTSLVSAMN